ncbi:homeobox-leucine zipper protein HAT4-like isoform X1 [Musa acuminata AAA Group]|uniref:homeobox-leucine zipper protein HAT4-like isoform X1 n=1 Tax=Musa acuminata AAA Group TaxID=214697 RepID=UPI0031CF5ACE
MMMMGKDDLGLSLSLSSSNLNLQLNLMPPSSSPASGPSTSPSFYRHQKGRWSDLVVHSAENGPVLDVGGAAAESRPRPLLRGVDVNWTPPGGEERNSGEDAGASSPNSTLSSVSGKRVEQDLQGPASSRGVSDDEDAEGSRKKLRLSKDQSAILEESFKAHNTLNPKQKLALAKQLNLRPRQVEVWFQNRRARTKLKQTETDRELLKRCCDTLTEENRRLQKEVQELRDLKLSGPQCYMHTTPPTTLSLCPSCERISNSATTTAVFHRSRPFSMPIRRVLSAAHANRSSS